MKRYGIFQHLLLSWKVRRKSKKGYYPKGNIPKENKIFWDITLRMVGRAVRQGIANPRRQLRLLYHPPDLLDRENFSKIIKEIPLLLDRMSL